MKKIFINLCTILCAVAFFSCSEETFDFEGNDGVIFVKAGSSNMVNSTSNSFRGRVLKTPAGVIMNMNVKFPVRCTAFASESVTATFEVDHSLVAQYNHKYGTDYATFDKPIQLKNAQLVISEGMAQSADSVEITFNRDDIATLENKNYLIPIKLTNVSGKYQVSDQWNVVYCLINVEESNIYSVDPQDKGTKYSASKSTWVLTASQSNFSSARNLLDNNYNNYSSYSISQLNSNTYYTLDLGTVTNNISGMENYFYASSYSINEYSLLSSVDGTTWVKQGTVSKSGVNSVDAFFYQPISARYLRVIPMKTASSVYFKEISIYTK